jgi:glycerophosphoryl diester phosphodiesterase
MLAVVDACGARERVLATSFAPELAADYARRAAVPGGWILPFPPGREDLEEWPSLAFVMLAVEAAIPEAIEPILEGGRVPCVWTVNDAAEGEALLAAGAASLVTDRPRKLVAKLGP